MIKVCRPYKNATLQKMAQGFSTSHQANDFASFYGDWLVAPFNAQVASVVSAGPLSASTDDLRRGYGMRLVSTEDPTVSISYWHCLPFFPVKKDDTVVQGQPVAQMGNSGFVLSGGSYVEVDIRTIPPYPGTHVHISMGQQSGDTYTALDMSKLIDFNIPIKYDVLTAIRSVLQKIINLLNKTI